MKYPPPLLHDRGVSVLPWDTRPASGVLFLILMSEVWRGTHGLKAFHEGIELVEEPGAVIFPPVDGLGEVSWVSGG